MERVHKPTVFLLAFFIAFSSLTTSTEGHKPDSGIHNARSGDTGAKREDHTKIPSNGFPYPGENTGYPQDLYGSMASTYFPASENGFQDLNTGRDGQKGSLTNGGYPPNFYGSPPIGYGYGYGYPFPFPFTGGIFGFPPGIFGFPPFRGIPGGYGGFPPFRGIPGGYGGFPPFRGIPGGYGGFPPFRGIPGGYGGFPPFRGIPGGYGGSPGGYGGSPGGYGGSPGGYGSGGPGNKPSGGGTPKAEMKGKEVNSHD